MTTHECLIIGGGAAGLSAALALGRARRDTLLVDAGRQSNLPAHGVGGLLGHDRRPPAQLYAQGRAELGEYPSVTIRDGEVTALAPTDDGDFSATLADGSEIAARRVVFVAGMDYRYPEVDGFAQRWGESVFHCPFCHGWEVRERPLCVLSPMPAGLHQSLMLRAWSDDVTLLCGPDGADAVDDEARARLRAAGVTIDERRAVAVQGPGATVESVVFEDGTERPCGGVLVFTPLAQRSQLPATLGIVGEATPMSPDPIAVDAMYTTSVPGLHAAGDALGRPPSVAGAMASGTQAAATVVAGLTGAI